MYLIVFIIILVPLAFVLMLFYILFNAIAPNNKPLQIGVGAGAVTCWLLACIFLLVPPEQLLIAVYIPKLSKWLGLSDKGDITTNFLFALYISVLIGLVTTLLKWLRDYQLNPKAKI
jgi:hypothetical protein